MLHKQIVIETDAGTVLIEHINRNCVTVTRGIQFGRHFAFNPDDRRVWTHRDSPCVPLLHDGVKFNEAICRDFLGLDNEVNHGV